MGACAKLAVAPDNSKKQPLRMAGFDRCPPILLNTVCKFIVLSFRTRQVVHSLHAFHHLFAPRHHLMISAHHVTLARCPAVLRVLAHRVARKHRSPEGGRESKYWERSRSRGDFPQFAQSGGSRQCRWSHRYTLPGSGVRTTRAPSSTLLPALWEPTQ